MHYVQISGKQPCVSLCHGYCLPEFSENQRGRVSSVLLLSPAKPFQRAPPYHKHRHSQRPYKSFRTARSQEMRLVTDDKQISGGLLDRLHERFMKPPSITLDSVFNSRPLSKTRSLAISSSPLFFLPRYKRRGKREVSADSRFIKSLIVAPVLEAKYAV